MDRAKWLCEGKAVDAIYIAVINESEQVSNADVEKATSAVQRQVNEDFGPAWDVSATVSFFSALSSKPNGYWPVVVRDDIGTGGKGAHITDDGQKPFALVLFSGSKWTVTLSHEILEMLVDPFGHRQFVGPSPRQGDGEVEYLAEVCDPCQADGCAYVVNGDQLVSDFVTKSFYTGSGSGVYSQTRNVTLPRQPVEGGYLTWYDLESRTYWQLMNRGAGPEFQTLDPALVQPNIHLRGTVDRVTAPKFNKLRTGVRNPVLARNRKRNAKQIHRHSTVLENRSRWWRAQIDCKVGHKE
jgi:hypothetical protein